MSDRDENISALKGSLEKSLDGMTKQTLDALKLVHSFQTKPIRSQQMHRLLDSKLNGFAMPHSSDSTRSSLRHSEASPVASERSGSLKKRGRDSIEKESPKLLLKLRKTQEGDVSASPNQQKPQKVSEKQPSPDLADFVANDSLFRPSLHSAETSASKVSAASKASAALARDHSGSLLKHPSKGAASATTSVNTSVPTTGGHTSVTSTTAVNIPTEAGNSKNLVTGSITTTASRSPMSSGKALATGTLPIKTQRTASVTSLGGNGNESASFFPTTSNKKRSSFLFSSKALNSGRLADSFKVKGSTVPEEPANGEGRSSVGESKVLESNRPKIKPIETRFRSGVTAHISSLSATPRTATSLTYSRSLSSAAQKFKTYSQAPVSRLMQPTVASAARAITAHALPRPNSKISTNVTAPFTSTSVIPNTAKTKSDRAGPTSVKMPPIKLSTISAFRYGTSSSRTPAVATVAPKATMFENTTLSQAVPSSGAPTLKPESSHKSWASKTAVIPPPTSKNRQNLPVLKSGPQLPPPRTANTAPIPSSTNALRGLPPVAKSPNPSHYSTPVRTALPVGPNDHSQTQSVDYSNFSNFSYVADWAHTPELAKRALEQRNIDPKALFGAIKPVDIDAIFGSEKKRQGLK